MRQTCVKLSTLVTTFKQYDDQDGSQYPAKHTDASEKVFQDELPLWQIKVTLTDFARLV